ncbi:unnamed protein product [Hymenolepis diminuta]|uniref:Uncharacterized protein n=1 Tax=Hymenolepis diminuta TaxID=6216 RepID=A0A0R3SKB7_HYMDI|nr:unnamed protein product [Hymenolepis diminuta]VUZ47909.1 unnamed protein product [Hymenolepis diminuta]
MSKVIVLFYAIPKNYYAAPRYINPIPNRNLIIFKLISSQKKSWAVTILAVGLVATPTLAMDAMVDTRLAAVDLAVMVVVDVVVDVAVDVVVAVEMAGVHAVETAVADVGAVMPVFHVSGTVADGLELLQQNRRRTARKCSC